jgi:sulfite exporter TauE/SafE
MLETTFLGGIAFGLASALHCAAMCGGVACGAMLALGAETSRERYRQLAIMQAGRVTTYTLLGATAAAIGSGIIAPARSAHSFQIMQWAGAVSLMWMGLVMTGVMPRLAVLDQAMLRLGGAVRTFTSPLRSRPVAGPFALGVAWGLNACPMVYGAAFFAALTGSVLNGAVFMSGFGLGTVPAIVAAASGITLLRSLTSRPGVRIAAGTLIALIGFASVYIPLQVVPAFCLTK